MINLRQASSSMVWHRYSIGAMDRVHLPLGAIESKRSLKELKMRNQREHRKQNGNKEGRLLKFKGKKFSKSSVYSLPDNHKVHPTKKNVNQMERLRCGPR